MRAVEGALRGHEGSCAVAAAAQRRERARLHRIQTGAEGGVVVAATEDRPAGLGQVESVTWAIELLNEVTEAGVHVGRQLDVARG
jgi:hypothetical protein